MYILLLYCIIQFNPSIIKIIELEVMMKGIRSKGFRYNNFMYDLLK